ncbi:MAG: radical SAM/SPASM domain-containing protein [Candidatus Thorarchaeota archaeon]
MSPTPELIDIAISNRCNQNCYFCYRNSTPTGPLMSMNDFKFLIDQLNGTFQVAIGGGEPTQHPDFISMLEYASDSGIVPNYTTNGTNLTDEVLNASKRHCGAVAVSWNKDSHESIRKLVNEGIKTNIHFVVMQHTINEALRLITDVENLNNLGVNAVVFLLHKAVGRGKLADTPTGADTQRLIRQALTGEAPVGFDTCFTPLISHAEQVSEVSVPWTLLDFCEASRFSMFVDQNLVAQPCSFCTGQRFSSNLRKQSLRDIWFGHKFDDFRALLKEDKCACPAIVRDV